MGSVRWPIPGKAEVHWQARAFGQTLGDLELDLRGIPAPVATTRVLASCLSEAGAPPAEDDLWSWTVNRRLQGLLAVTVATRGEAWTPSIVCANEACAAPMDLPLRLTDFLRREDPTRINLTGAIESLEVTVPTGDDQRAWLQQGSDEPATMLARLLPPGAPIPAPASVAAIEQGLAEADPLTVLDIETRCPECGAENHMALDLENTCLAMLAGEQPRLIDDIHALALAYHWTEAEILAVAPERRRQYLERLDRGWP